MPFRRPIFRLLAAARRAGLGAVVCLAAAAATPGAALAAEAQAAIAPSEAALKARDFKLAGDATRIRFVLNFDREPDIKWFLLKNPHRLVIDLPDTRFLIDPGTLEPHGLVTGIRYGRLGEGNARLILAAAGPFAVETIDILKNEESEGYRLVGDVSAASEDAFEVALSEQIGTTGSTVATTRKGDRLGARLDNRDGVFTVVIDPGHGGIDGGAKGVSGTSEKEITLTFGKELKALLEKSERYRVFLTRDEDVFIRLDERVRIARQHGADLFISVHADMIRHSGIRGATVYTVSDKASDADAAAYAARENLADELAGIEVEDENHEVADILADFMRRETHGFSIRFARSLLDELSDTVKLINNPHRFAGFKVLRAPDVPSVLLELGYLSNKEDEEQLRSEAWRQKVAESIAGAIDGFAGRRVGAGG